MLTVTATDLPRLMACNGSRLMGGGQPPIQGDDAVRSEGNAVDWLVGQVFNRIHTAEELIDRKAPNGVYITLEMVEYLEEYLKAIGTVGNGVMIERDTSFTRADRWQINGRADLLCYDAANAHLTVGDLKYGWAIVEPEENWALISHAIGFMQQNPAIPVASITFVIYQPRPHHPAGRVRSWPIDVKHLRQLAIQLDEMLCNPSDLLRTSQHCYRCPALATCPAARKAQMNGIDAAEMAFVDNIDNDTLSFQLDHLKRASKMLEQLEKAYGELALFRMKQGQVIQNYSIENELTNRQWMDHLTPEFVEILTGKELTKKQLITPAQAEKLGVAKDVVNTLTERRQKGFKIVRADANAKAQQMFGKIGAVIMLCLLLTGCGTVNIVDHGDRKRIELTGFTAAPATNEVRGIMEMTSYKQCPNGYQILNQRFNASPKMLVWNVQCTNRERN